MFIPESKLESFKVELAKLNKKLAKYDSSVEILACRSYQRTFRIQWAKTNCSNKM